jgi:hypothetical protein
VKGVDGEVIHSKDLMLSELQYKPEPYQKMCRILKTHVITLFLGNFMERAFYPNPQPLRDL